MGAANISFPYDIAVVVGGYRSDVAYNDQR